MLVDAIILENMTIAANNFLVVIRIEIFILSFAFAVESTLTVESTLAFSVERLSSTFVVIVIDASARALVLAVEHIVSMELE